MLKQPSTLTAGSFPIDQQLAVVLIACLEELEEFRPENRDTIDWAERTLAEYYRPGDV